MLRKEGPLLSVKPINGVVPVSLSCAYYCNSSIYPSLLTPSLHIDPYNTLRETISSPGLLMPTSCHIDINRIIFLVGNNTCASHKNLNLTPPQGFSQVLFLFPSPPEKRGNERVAAGALQRPYARASSGVGACCQSERLVRSPDRKISRCYNMRVKRTISVLESKIESSQEAALEGCSITASTCSRRRRVLANP
jgi:hypothetical protein